MPLILRPGAQRDNARLLHTHWLICLAAWRRLRDADNTDPLLWMTLPSDTMMDRIGVAIAAALDVADDVDGIGGLMDIDTPHGDMGHD